MSNTMLKTNPDDQDFINAIKNLNEGDKLEVADGTLIVEGKFTRPTHFPFHQRIFPAGMILKVEGRNVRIFIEAEKLGMSYQPTKKGEFDDKQIDEKGNILPADPGTQGK